MRWISLYALILLAGCGNVTVTQVNADGKPTERAAEGFYVPRLMPYLIVADLPPDPTPPASGRNGGSPPARRPLAARAPTPAAPGKNNQDQANPANATASATATASNSDLSFVALTKLYVIKLVYLPDYSHQQAIKATSGWFGKASLQLQLTDGTLSSLNANNDNTENGEVFKAAMTALITAASGGASGAGAAVPVMKAANQVQYSAQSSSPTAYASGDVILHPGIYQLHYNDQGVFVGLERVTGFCSATGYSASKRVDDPTQNLPVKSPHMVNDDCTPVPDRS